LKRRLARCDDIAPSMIVDLLHQKPVAPDTAFDDAKAHFRHACIA